MATRFADDHAWINILFRAAILFAGATYLVGAATLILGTLLSLVLLAYQWLRYGGLVYLLTGGFARARKSRRKLVVVPRNAAVDHDAQYWRHTDDGRLSDAFQRGSPKGAQRERVACCAGRANQR